MCVAGAPSDSRGCVPIPDPTGPGVKNRFAINPGPEWYVVLWWLVVTETDIHAVLTLCHIQELLAPLTVPGRC